MSNTILTEKDLELIFFNRSLKKKRVKLYKIIYIVFSTIIILGLTYLIINYQSIFNNFGFWYKTDFNNTAENNAENIIVIPKTITTKTEMNLPQIENNSISIPDIEIKAPISWNVKNSPEEVSSKLRTGVIHLEGTSLPGQTGNVFITGHSSNYPWIKGNYNNIFSLLNKLVVGNLIQVKYNDNDYLYKVSSMKVVKPTDLSVLKPTPSPVLSLMTCTPVGTSLNRLIIISDQIYPDPKSNTKSDKAGGGFMPKIR